MKHPSGRSTPSISGSDEKLKPSLAPVSGTALSTLVGQTPTIPREGKHRTREALISTSMNAIKGKIKEDNSDLMGQDNASRNGDIGHPTLSVLKSQKVEPASEATRTLRQAQQKQRKEQWQRQFVSVAQEDGVQSTEEQEPRVVAELAKCEMELLSNGQYNTNTDCC